MDLNLGHTRALIDECRRQGLLRNQCAYVLATAYHETAHTMKPIYERGSKAYFNKYDAGTKIGKNLGNTKKGDGYLYRGRGFVQLTGRANYAKYGLTDNPDKALEPKIAADIAVTGMRKGTFTGKKLADYITLAKSDFVNARRIINGTDKAGLIAQHARAYDMDLKVMGYGEGKPGSVAAAIPVPKPPPVPKASPAPAQVAEKPHVVLMDGPKGDETTVVVVKTPQNVAQTNPTPSSKTGYAAFGAMVIAIGAAAAKYFGG